MFRKIGGILGGIKLDQLAICISHSFVNGKGAKLPQSALQRMACPHSRKLTAAPAGQPCPTAGHDDNVPPRHGLWHLPPWRVPSPDRQAGPRAKTPSL
jgi:hypothetical protein